MNSEAVALMKLGRNKEAVCLLITATRLSLSPRLEQEDMNDSEVRRNSEATETSSGLRSAEERVIASVVIPIATTLNANSANEEPKSELRITSATGTKDESFFFPRAFEILHEKDSLDDDSSNSLVSISTVILFNIALACHCQGIETGDTRAYTKALAVYTKAYTLVEKQDLNACNSLGVVMLSILTNIIHIHSIVHNTVELHAAMRMFCHVYEWARHSCALKEEDQRFFSSRALFCACQRTIVAAAA